MIKYIIRQTDIVVVTEDSSEILLIIKVPGKAINWVTSNAISKSKLVKPNISP